MRPFLADHYGTRRAPLGRVPAKDAVEKPWAGGGSARCDPTEVVFTSGGRVEQSTPSRGLLRQRDRGDHIITTAVSIRHDPSVAGFLKR